jgi:5-methylcytosine-specific restriction endonuclease McrA
MKNGLRTLVLNNSYMPLSLFPLSVTTAEDAIHNYFGGSCTIVTSYEIPIKTPSRDDLYWPSVIANHNGHSFRKELRLRKELLYYRDHCVCMYCGKELTVATMTYDHVQPRTKGGPHSWDNVVASCKDCNNAKSDEVNPKKWKPKHAPWTPNYFQMIDIRKRYPIVVDDESWIDFLPKWSAPIIVKPSVLDKNLPILDGVQNDQSTI